jgi:hypothetical protein
VVAAWRIETKWNFAWSVPILLAVLMLPQYGALAYINAQEGFRSTELNQVADVIHKSEREIGPDDSRAQIMGDYSLWFAHPAHYRALARTTLTYIPREDLFLCFDGPIRPPVMVDPIILYCADVTNIIQARDIDRITVRGHLLRILAPVRALAK